MTIATQLRDGVHLVHLSGQLGPDTDSDLITVVNDLLAPRGARVVLDLSAVTYMNSQGLGQLVQLVAQANMMEGRVVLATPQPFVADVLAATQLDRFFTIAPTLEDALGRLREASQA